MIRLTVRFTVRLESETTKGNDTVFEITFDGLDRKCKEKGDQKERENQTLSISAHPNTRRKIDFYCTNCIQLIRVFMQINNLFLSNIFNSDTIVFVIHFL